MCLLIIRTLIKMIPAEMQRVIYLYSFLSNNISIPDDLDITNIIPDWLVIPKQESILRINIIRIAFKNISGGYRAVDLFYPDFKSWIEAASWVVDNGFFVFLIFLNFRIL